MNMNGRMIRRSLLSSGIGFLGLILTAAAFAGLISEEILGQEHLDLTGAVALVMGGLLAGLSCGGGEGRWLRAGISFLGVEILLLLVNLVGFGAVLSGFLPCSVLLAGSVAAPQLAKGAGKGRRRRNHQIKKYRNG